MNDEPNPMLVVDRIRMPIPGVRFELVFDGAIFSPTHLAQRAFLDSQEWSHDETKTITGIHVCAFRVVTTEPHDNFEEVITECLYKTREQNGRVPSGQWLLAFNTAIIPDGIHPVGVLDFSWKDSQGRSRFPLFDKNGVPIFLWKTNIPPRGLFWLMQVD